MKLCAVELITRVPSLAIDGHHEAGFLQTLDVKGDDLLTDADDLGEIGDRPVFVIHEDDDPDADRMAERGENVREPRGKRFGTSHMSASPRRVRRATNTGARRFTNKTLC